MNNELNPNELPPDEELPPTEAELEKRLQSWKERVEMAQREQLAFMSTQPQSKPCKIHPDSLMLINGQETLRLSRPHAFEFVAGYAPCSKCVQDVKNRNLKEFGVPENLIHATFENYNPDGEVEAEQIRLIKEFSDKRTGFLILTGGYGTGKTHLSVASLRIIGGGWLVKQASLLRYLRDTYGDKAAFDPIERAQRARLFILDDAGLSGGGKDELPMLHEILDFRHGERLPTIITSNLPFEKLSDVLGDPRTTIKIHH